MEERLIQHFEDSFDRILIHDDSWDTPVADRIRKLFSIQKVQRTSGKVYENSGTLTAEEFNKSKRQILVTKHKGSFFKRCPGAKPGLVCCNYFVLNLGLQCNMNCSYCYLQSYINTPYLTIYSNIDDAKNEIKEIADQYPNLHYRVGTGETIDSLSMDPITHYSKDLIAFFKNYPNWILELKTKSSFVDHFLNESHAGNVLVSWSINPQYVISKEEHGTASLEERLSSAKKCVDRGFKIAFHFDPMIFHENWKENYGDLIDQIQNRFQPSEVDLITIGSVRFKPEQRFMMKDRFGSDSLVFQSELFTSETGKMRYDHELRSEMINFARGRFLDYSRDWRVSLCMEVPETWATTMSTTPRKIPEISELFAPRPKTKPSQIHSSL